MVGTERYTDEQKFYILSAKKDGVSWVEISNECTRRFKSKQFSVNGVKYIYNKCRNIEGMMDRADRYKASGMVPNPKPAPPASFPAGQYRQEQNFTAPGAMPSNPIPTSYQANGFQGHNNPVPDSMVPAAFQAMAHQGYYGQEHNYPASNGMIQPAFHSPPAAAYPNTYTSQRNMGLASPSAVGYGGRRGHRQPYDARQNPGLMMAASPYSTPHYGNENYQPQANPPFSIPSQGQNYIIRATNPVPSTPPPNLNQYSYISREHSEAQGQKVAIAANGTAQTPLASRIQPQQRQSQQQQRQQQSTPQSTAAQNEGQLAQTPRQPSAALQNVYLREVQRMQNRRRLEEMSMPQPQSANTASQLQMGMNGYIPTPPQLNMTGFAPSYSQYPQSTPTTPPRVPASVPTQPSPCGYYPIQNLPLPAQAFYNPPRNFVPPVQGIAPQNPSAPLPAKSNTFNSYPNAGVQESATQVDENPPDNSNINTGEYPGQYLLVEGGAMDEFLAYYSEPNVQQPSTPLPERELDENYFVEPIPAEAPASAEHSIPAALHLPTTPAQASISTAGMAPLPTGKGENVRRTTAPPGPVTLAEPLSLSTGKPLMSPPKEERETISPTPAQPTPRSPTKACLTPPDSIIKKRAPDSSPEGRDEPTKKRRGTLPMPTPTPTPMPKRKFKDYSGADDPVDEVARKKADTSRKEYIDKREAARAKLEMKIREDEAARERITREAAAEVEKNRRKIDKYMKENAGYDYITGRPAVNNQQEERQEAQVDMPLTGIVPEANRLLSNAGDAENAPATEEPIEKEPAEQATEQRVTGEAETTAQTAPQAEPSWKPYEFDRDPLDLYASDEEEPSMLGPTAEGQERYDRFDQMLNAGVQFSIDSSPGDEVPREYGQNMHGFDSDSFPVLDEFGPDNHAPLETLGSEDLHDYETDFN